MACTDDGMACKLHLVDRCEDIDPWISIASCRVQEYGLGEVELLCDSLLLVLRQVDTTDFHNGDRVAFESMLTRISFGYQSLSRSVYLLDVKTSRVAWYELAESL